MITMRSDRAISIELDSTIDHTASATYLNFTAPNILQLLLSPYFVHRNYPSGESA